ncbi:MAG: ABC transporter permease [Candidatus Omnitrophota bacterium]
MSFEWFVAKRYLWSRRRHPFAGVMATISVLGIAVGVAALIVVMGVMSGFDEDLKSRIIGVRAHLVVEADGPVAQSVVLAQKLRKVPGVSGVSGFVEGQALVQVGSWGTGVLARGIDTRSDYDAFVARHRKQTS